MIFQLTIESVDDECVELTVALGRDRDSLRSVGRLILRRADEYAAFIAALGVSHEVFIRDEVLRKYLRQPACKRC